MCWGVGLAGGEGCEVGDLSNCSPNREGFGVGAGKAVLKTPKSSAFSDTSSISAAGSQ